MLNHRRLLPTLCVASFAAFLVANCGPIRSTLDRPPTPAELAELWAPPGDETRQQALYGPGGAEAAPNPDVIYKQVEVKKGGFSPKVEVVDPSGRKWTVKMGPEAQSEVTSSRILWMLGYRQPPEYCLTGWKLGREDGVHTLGPGRFRPHLDWVDGKGQWKWSENPFVGSQPYRGLLVLMMVLNNTDLKDNNNEVYRVKRAGGHSEHWYSVRDLGASLGETGWSGQRRNNIEFFEKQAFITGVNENHPVFEFHGRRKGLLDQVTVADVRWICEGLRALTPEQRRDAFKASGYDEETTRRYLAKIDEKVGQGLSLAAEGKQ